MRTLRVERRLSLPVSRESIWRYVADTDRLDREVGLPPVQFSFEPLEQGGSRVEAIGRFMGLSFQFIEHPSEWVRPHYYKIARDYKKGPVKQTRLGVDLLPVEQGTELRVWGEIQTGNPLSALLVRGAAARVVDDMTKAFENFSSFLQKSSQNPYPRHSARPPANRARLEQTLKKLLASGADEDIARRLAHHLAEAPPEDVALIRPFSLADEWRVDRTLMLTTCLLATRAGMLDLSWRLLCPKCKGGPAKPHLGDLPHEGYCTMCDEHIGAELDRSVEVCFSAPASIRAVKQEKYCISGPALYPHIAAQFAVAPGGRTELVDLPSGTYRLSSPQAREAVEIHLHDAHTQSPSVAITPSGDRVRLVCTETAPTKASWFFSNETSHTVVVRFELPVWKSDIATAAVVTSLQSFRDQFSSEVLSPGAQMAVRNISIMFSDLQGSTAHYHRVGDAPSYRAVREHFATMTDIVTRRQGAVVKTIGDSIMAVFSDPVDALQAALEIDETNRSEPSGLRVKSGLHCGPALMVNANDVLDYFGQTINLAARFQRLCHGGEIVLSASMADEPGAARLLRHVGSVKAELEDAVVRGLTEPVQILRLRREKPVSETEQPAVGR